MQHKIFGTGYLASHRVGLIAEDYVANYRRVSFRTEPEKPEDAVNYPALSSDGTHYDEKTILKMRVQRGNDRREITINATNMNIDSIDGNKKQASK